MFKYESLRLISILFRIHKDVLYKLALWIQALFTLLYSNPGKKDRIRILEAVNVLNSPPPPPFFYVNNEIKQMFTNDKVKCSVWIRAEFGSGPVSGSFFLIADPGQKGPVHNIGKMLISYNVCHEKGLDRRDQLIVTLFALPIYHSVYS